MSASNISQERSSIDEHPEEEQSFERWLRQFQDYESEPPYPWFAIARVPAERVWVQKTQFAYLSARGTAVRLWVAGMVESLSVESARMGEYPTLRVLLRLMREEDRVALGALYDSALAVRPYLHAPRGTVELFEAELCHDWSYLFMDVYDARGGYKAREKMSRIYPPVLEAGDMVLVETVAIRVDEFQGSRVRFVAYQMSLLRAARNLPPSGRMDFVEHWPFPFVL